MKELSISDVLKFFQNLDFKDKVDLLNQFTLELKKGVENITEKKEIEAEESSEEQLIDELFGIWEAEKNLTEETIIDRTVSDRDINLN
ncbi:MAG: hypothetical protein AAFO07_02005 [Bacteroidota bacterium]